jgi:C_GCAxxG_C_C family probable redox protein
VLVLIQEISGLKNDMVVKSSTGFSGGIGGLQSVCGALIGSALALGMKYGREIDTSQEPDEETAKNQGQAIEQVARLAKWFEREFGSIICSELRKSYMGTELSLEVPWQREWAEKLGMLKRCQEMVARTARRTLAMLGDPEVNIADKV